MSTRRILGAIAALGIVLAAVFGWAWVSTRSDLEASRSELAELRQSLTHARTIVYANDGDTIELDGKESVRILGIDTPEMWRKRGGKWERIVKPDPRAAA